MNIENRANNNNNNNKILIHTIQRDTIICDNVRARACECLCECAF